MAGMCFESFRAWRRRCGAALRELGFDRSGTTAVEYGIMVAGPSIAIIGIVFILGEDLAQQFRFVAVAIAAWV